MAVWTIHNFGKIQYIMYKGVPHRFPHDVRLTTENEELAKLVAKFPYISVKQKAKPLDEMSKKELLQKAATLGIKTTGLNKPALREVIQSATT